MSTSVQYYQYGHDELTHLKARDPQLAQAIDALGHLYREVTPDVYASLVNCIVGQQISTKAQQTIWKRMTDAWGSVTPEIVAACSDNDLQQFGLSFRKVTYIKGITERVLSGALDLSELVNLSDNEVRHQLSSLPGVGAWTAEMLMIFSMQRPDIVSYGDLAIVRGMRMLYHHRRITPQLFEKYRRRYAPYGTTASLYLWAIAGGTLPHLRDWAPKTTNPAKSKKVR